MLKRSNGEDSTTGKSGSFPDLHKPPDLSGLKVCHFCWLPTLSQAGQDTNLPAIG